MTSWGQILDKIDDRIISSTLTRKELTHEFDSGFGEINGSTFTAWSEKYVYFPVCYDGAESIGRAPRDPCSEKTPHIGFGDSNAEFF